jgi:hypothetical protein
VAKPADPDWGPLRRELLERVAAYAPDWTDPTGTDPGITLVELFAFLGESLLDRPDISPLARARLREILTRLDGSDASDCADGTLVRNRYFFGKLMSVEDFAEEQEYNRAKHRRHNRLLHGVGIVHGLGVSVETDSNGGQFVVVEPGLAIAPDGEEVVVCERVLTDPCPNGDPCYVSVYLLEAATRPVAALTDSTDETELSRIVESAGIAVSGVVPDGHLVIGRIIRGPDAWRVDPAFKPKRVGPGS